MSTSANPAMQGYSPLTQISAHSALKMAQAAGMIVPPAYIVLTLGRRRPLTIAGLMRATTANTIAWAGIGGAGAYAYLQNQPEDKLVDRVQRLVSASTSPLDKGPTSSRLRPSLARGASGLGDDTTTTTTSPH